MGEEVGEEWGSWRYRRRGCWGGIGKEGNFGEWRVWDVGGKGGGWEVGKEKKLEE